MSLRIQTFNLNGIRSANKKGYFDWLAPLRPDFVAVQELKAQEPEIRGGFEEQAGLKGYFHFAQKKGYSGVGLYCRHEPSEVTVGLGSEEFDAEGRWVEARFDRPGAKLSIISCYFPSGSSSEQRQEAKYRFLDLMEPRLMKLQAEREFLLLGDVNIAHQEIDLKNWKGNQKNSGFLPEERAFVSRILEKGLVDVFRRLNREPDQYTWWSQRGQARAKNVGWRIDYHLATAALGASAQSARIDSLPHFSDHAPLTIDYDWTL